MKAYADLFCTSNLNKSNGQQHELQTSVPTVKQRRRDQPASLEQIAMLNKQHNKLPLTILNISAYLSQIP